jgi:demethylmenaquinone methyltransferase/2-methoxy-6-polyprenyl-1,4-benzoquinol methylase
VDELRAYYAARAREYDRIYARPERQTDLRAIEAWLPPLFDGRATLEIACGTGHWTQLLAPRVASLLALDAAAETLALATARVRDAKVRFVVGDAYAPPVPAAHFDAAFAGFWFSHVPRARRQEFLAALHATLRSGARVVLLDNRYVEGSSTPLAERDAAGDTWQLRPLADRSTHRVLKNFPTEPELRTALAEHAARLDYHQWPHYWAVHYDLRT